MCAGTGDPRDAAGIDARGDGEEVDAVVKAAQRRTRQAHVDLVDEPRRL
jgi:hypothetical protein